MGLLGAQNTAELVQHAIRIKLVSVEEAYDGAGHAAKRGTAGGSELRT